MPIDFPPIYYTATMVKILREQGSNQYATDLAELILRDQPDNQEVQRLLAELKEEARKAFERFKAGGKAAEVAVESTSESEIEEEASAEPEARIEAEVVEEGAKQDPIVDLELPREANHLTLVELPVSVFNLRQRNIQLLRTLLERVQKIRKFAHATQT